MAFLGQEIKKLGFGLMRLPMKNGKIDIEETKAMVDMFLENGFTYFDTARIYGESESAIRKALVERYPRDKYLLASKNAAWYMCKSREEAISQLNISLEKTGAEYFDFYLLHNIGDVRTKFFEKYDMWNFVKEQKEKGLIKHIGFSLHSTPEELDRLLTEHPEMEFVQLQINYADWDNPAVQSRGCYEVARKHNKPIIVMEPVKGGLLATPPNSVEKVLKNAEPSMSIPSWAIRFAADLEGVITVLSGMSNLEQMKDNISFMKEFTGLTLSQHNTLDLAKKALKEIPLIPCTSCNYCVKVCPKNIGISGSFNAMNIFHLYNNLPGAKHQINWMMSRCEKNGPLDCINCGRCENACPQHISIREELCKVAETLLK